MGTAILKIKVMPSSLKTDLEKLKENIKKNLEEAGAVRVSSIEEEPVAFGLKSLIVTFAWPEQLETEKAEKAIKNIDEVSSEEIIDYRRAFG